MKAKTFKAVSFSVIGVILAIFIALNIACALAADTITDYLCGYAVDEEAYTAARLESAELAQQIEEEGIVMTQNDNDTLPLDKESDSKVNVFGWSSTQWVYGGSGSGMVKSGDDDVDLLGALTDAGIGYNTELTDMYTGYLSSRPYYSSGSLATHEYQFSRLYEPSIDDSTYYTDSLLENAKEYSDTALVVIGRVGGESNDMPKAQYKGEYDASAYASGTDERDESRTYMEISTEEEALLEYVGANFDNVVVIINSANVMELGFMETIDGLDSCLLVGYTGNTGASAIPEVLYGDVSPSGRTADTFAYALEDGASYANSGGSDGENLYANATSDLYPLIVTNGNVGDSTTAYDGVAYVDYVEDIYVGYRWYETADAEGYWDSVSNEYGEGYEGVVQYPFGFGLSYTEFSWEIVEISHEDGTKLTGDGTVEMTVRVTNEGDVAGQDVAELYFTPPYEDGEVEKSEVALLDYAKTQTVEPGDYEDLTLSFDIRDMASYDTEYDNGDGTYGRYIMDEGDYEISLRTDSHTEKDLLVSANSAEDGVITYEADSRLTFAEDAVTGATVSNKFTGDGAMDGISLDNSDSGSGIDWLSRSDFRGTFPSALAAARDMTQNLIDTNLYTEEDANAWIDESDEAVTFGADNGLSVTTDGYVNDLGLALGADYDDERWDTLLDQLDKEEALECILNAYCANYAISSIGKPKLTDVDGPNQIGSYGMASSNGTGFPCEVVLAQTWDKNLAYDLGLALGKEGIALGYSGWYGPGLNMHRSPFGGRNYEYYSEDPYLSGTMAANSVRGARNTGMYVYLKHLALYEQEWNRDSIYTWCTEQAMREIYLKPFQMAIQDGGANGIMTSYNRIGAVWAGGSPALLDDEGVVRGEWGFRGAVLTDYSDHHEYMNGDQMIRAGGDLWMSGFYIAGFYGSPAELNYETDSNSMDQAIRRAVKNITYMYLSSQYANATYNEAEDTVAIVQGSKTDVFAWWIPVLIAVDVAVVAGCAVWAVFAVRRKKDK